MEALAIAAPRAREWAGTIGVDLTACWRPRVGMVTVAVELTRALLDRSTPGDPARVTAFCSRGRPPGVGPDRCRAVLSPHRDEVVNKLTWLPLVESEAGLDVVLYPYWPCPPFRRRAAPPAVIFVHDLAFRLRPDEVPWQQRAYLGSLLPRALELAAAITVPSAVTRSDLLECYPIAGLDLRVRVVPEAPTPLSAEAARLPHGLEPGYLLAVGTVERRKNYLRLLEAYRQLRQLLRQVPPLVVAGRLGWDCRVEARELRTAPGVRFLDHVTDSTLAALYRGAGVFAFPSLYEGFGLPLLDAMVRGLPALIGDQGALPELAAGAALEVDAEDPAAIAAGLGRLLEDAALRSQLADRARARAAEFSWQRSAGLMMDVLAEAATA